MQQREDDVDLAERPRGLRRLGDDQVGGVAVAGQRDRRALAVDAGQLVGSRSIRSRSGSPDSSTQRPSVAMPIGTTSYASRSIAASTLPAVTQEIACSLDRPPKTTATRGLRGGLVHRADPSRPRVVAHAGGLARPAPATVAVTAGRPAARPDQPLNAPLTMASTYVAGGDLEYGRYGNPTWTAFEDALGALEGGRCLSFASGLAAVVDRARPGRQRTAWSSRRGTPTTARVMQLADLEARGRLRAGWSTSPTPTRSSPPATTPPWSGWSRRPTRRSRSPTSRRSARPRTRPGRTSSSTTPSPLPCSSSRSTSAPTSSCTRRRSTSPATATSCSARSSPATTSCTACSRAGAT